MSSGNRLIVGVVCLVALAALSYGCQVGDGFSPTEADRSIQQAATTCDPDLAAEIRALIPAVITDPIVGKSVTSQFNAIVKAWPKNLSDARAKTRTTTDFIMKHFAAGKWTDADGTGILVTKMFQFVGLLPEAQNATACIPGMVECELLATEDNEFAGVNIPGSSITQPFVIYVFPLPDLDVDPPFFGLVYEIATIPAGITFQSAPSGSLTLAAEDDQPVVGICALDSSDPEGIPDGVHPDSLHVVHFVNGQWVRLPQVDITFILTELDCSTASSTETASLWSNPLLETVVDLLSPGRVVAAGTRTGGAITSFSPHATEVAGPIPTTTTLSIVEGKSTFFAGETITLRAVVNPEPTGGNVAFFATTPVSGPGAPVVPVVDGVATRSFVCGSSRVPFGSHDAQAQYLGFEDFQGSVSTTIPYECLEGSGD